MPTCICGHLHTNAKKSLKKSVRSIDPTRTLTIRRKYEGAIVRRFKTLRALIVQVVMGSGLTTPIATNALSTNGLSANSATAYPLELPRFEFTNSADKIQAFRAWLDKQVDKGILDVTTRDGLAITGRVPWQNIYVRSAYQAGLNNAYPKLARAGYTNPTEIGSTAPALSFNVPIHSNTLQSLYTRNFEELRGITDAMSAGISRSLTQSLAEGRGAADTARALVKSVDGIGINRARMLARTETIRAHAEATLNTYAQAGVEGVTVEAEILTAGDDRVCEECASLEGTTYTLDQARGLIPVHPNCRCSWVPMVA